MKIITSLVLIAIVSALIITILSGGQSFEEKLINLSLKDTLGSDADGVLSESPELQALFLDYSGATITTELVLKSRIAISKYGEEARSVLKEYGGEPEFKEILTRYGENVVPVIQYFVQNDPFLTRFIPGFKRAGIERGWYAVQHIQRQGHDFMGQFEIDVNKKAHWIQTKRVLTAVTDFFTSGVRTIETKYVLDEEIKKADIFWVGVDATVVLSTVKALRALKSARAGNVVRTGTVGENVGKELSLTARSKMFTSRLIPKGFFGRTILKGGAAVGLVYVIGKHPSLLNSLFAYVAEKLGLNKFLVQVICWAILVFVLSAMLAPILWVVLPLVIRALSFLLGTLSYLDRIFARRKSKVASMLNIAEPT